MSQNWFSFNWVQEFFKYVLLFVVQSLPHGIINYLPRKGFTKDYTKGSMLAVKLQVMDRLWPMKLYIYEGKYRSCVVSVGWSAFASRRCLRIWRTMLCSKFTFSDLLIKWLLTLHCKLDVGDVLLWELIILQILCLIFKDLFCQNLTVGSLLVFTNIYV